MNKSHEEEIKRFWEARSIYEKLKESSKGRGASGSSRKKFYFLDGPPYATGSIHMGTAWNKILKDTYIRFWRMSGFDVWDQPGYDTHGLPIENKVEKDFQIKSKSDIEKLGIEKFVHECRKFATKYIDIMNQQFANLGVWMDWKNPYLTLDNEYIEGAWHTFKIAFEKGLLYQGLYPVHVCPHCETAVAYNEIEYTKVSDPSVYVKFPTKDGFLLIWTTTPWTLPSNTGIMAKPSADYVKVKVGKETLIMAKVLMDDVMKRAGVTSYKIIGTMKGKKLDGLEYEHPLIDIFKFQEPVKHRVVLSEQYVELESGTGLVHTAPGFGQEDYKVGVENGLSIISPLKLDGTFNETCGQFAGIFAKTADRKIIDILKERNLLLHEEKVTHDYPLCWRCSSPLLEMAVTQWFFKVTQIRKELLKENKKVKWYPEWAGQRFENWLNSLGDWPISRQRYWGIPLPIWTCSCGEVKIIGSSNELPKLTDAQQKDAKGVMQSASYTLKDLHRPYIDDIRLPCKCGKEMSRIHDVLDVWFDSGLASWASLGYPNRKELFENMWPADLNIEGPDQIRGWWNSQLITGVITFNKAPFKNILFHGFTLDAHGSKMSKSKGNIISPEEVIDKYGRDVLRLYLLSSAPWEDFYFKWTDVDAIAKSFMVLENTYNYVKSYAPKAKKVKDLEPEDAWILSRLNNLIEEVTKHYRTYNIHKAVNAITNFMLNDFSRVYIKMVRDRVWPTYSGSDKQSAMFALFEVAKECSKLLAPACPFFAEHVYQIGELGKEESVHMCKWPKPYKKYANPQIEKEMEIVQEIIETANAVRKENNVKIRWPVENVYIESDDETVKGCLITFEKVLKNMTNSKYISHGKSEGYSKAFSKGTVYVSKNVLKAEALMRELLREIQSHRKLQKLIVEDKIVLYLDNDSMQEFEREIRDKVGAKNIIFGPIEKPTGQVQLEDEKVSFKIETLQKIYE
ncbi:MAG: isoleucyl-tRNA synthetase [archaeon GW2011_AR5]|nr:MAG: isoleucyl-tRNA synthetase [archaeon GW2011_AR5]